MTDFADVAYAPALCDAAGANVRSTYGLFLGGAWQTALAEATFGVANPATAETIAAVAAAEAADVERAVRAARRGYDKYWRKMRAAERAKYLYRIARIVLERAGSFAILESLETGTPIRSAERDVALAAETLFYFAGWADKLEWAVGPGERARALGVAAVVLPQASALLAASRRTAPALAAGNAVVVKPSPRASLAALHLADACAAADLPPGVFNVVTGGDATGVSLFEHPDVDAIGGACSAAAGRAILSAAAGRAKRVDLAVPGSPTVLVFDDAPLDAAIEGIVATMLTGGRLFVAESVAGEVIAALVDRLRTLRHGDPLDRNTEVGALGSTAARDAVDAFARAAVEAGAEVVSAPWTAPERGAWFPASLVRAPEPAHRILREDIPAPLLAYASFRTPAEAIDRANATPAAASVGVWTGGGTLAMHVAHGLRTGSVYTNALPRAGAETLGAIRAYLGT